MKKIKVVTVVGTRPELIRLSRLIPLLDDSCDHVLVHTGQNSDPNLKEVFFQDLRLREPDYYLEASTRSFVSMMADTMVKCEQIFEKELPQAVAILGDTNSGVAAVVAERMGIPVYHMEAGNRSFDRNVPEELNRKLIDHVSTFNLPYNSFSERNLLAEGKHPRFLNKTGSPMREVLNHFLPDIENSDVLSRLGLGPKSYILASVHRQENVDSEPRLRSLIASLEKLQKHFSMKVLVSTHPRTRASLQRFGLGAVKGIEFSEPFGFLDYCKLQKEANLVVSDSGTVSEESALLGFAAISPRDSMERPEALESGSMMITGLHPDSVLRAAIRVTSNKSSNFSLPEGYEVDDFSERVLRFMLSTSPLVATWTGLNDRV